MSPLERHRRFLNRYYGVSRWFYDLTRKYYLFGRDRALRALLEEPWSTLVEVGPGTGRNLTKLRRARPTARLGGIDASDAMLEYARGRVPWAALAHGYAETADYGSVLGDRPARILFSYCLSMVDDKRRALEHARKSVAPGGAVYVVDFGEHPSWPWALRSTFDGWLRTFHVEPLRPELLRGSRSVTRGPFDYYVIARFDAL